MNPLNFMLGEKIRQRHLTAELKRSKAFTNPATITPLFDAIATISRRTGKSGDEITAEHYADESRYPEITAAIAFHQPAIAAQAPAKPAVAIVKPSTITTMQTTKLSPTKAPTATATATVTAAAFAKPQTAMLRSEWQNLSAKDKSRFFAEGGKLV
jgi:hypothetical protein